MEDEENVKKSGLFFRVNNIYEPDDFCGDTIIVGDEKFSEETVEFSFGFEMELRYKSGYSNFENFTAVKKGSSL